jgi:hypothetical protein
MLGFDIVLPCIILSCLVLSCLILSCLGFRYCHQKKNGEIHLRFQVTSLSTGSGIRSHVSIFHKRWEVRCMEWKGMGGVLMAAQDGWISKRGTTQSNTRHGICKCKCTKLHIPEISRTYQIGQSSLALVVNLGLDQQVRV